MAAIKLLENSSRNLTTTVTTPTYTTQGENLIYVLGTVGDIVTITISDEDIAQKRFPIVIQDISPDRNNVGTLIINCESGQTINDETTYIIEVPYQAVQINSDGTNCFLQSNSFKDSLALVSSSVNTQITATLDTYQNVIFGPADTSSPIVTIAADGTFTFLKTGYYNVSPFLHVVRSTAAGSGNVTYAAELRIAGVRTLLDVGYLGDNTWHAHPDLEWEGYISKGSTGIVRIGASSINSSINDVRLTQLNIGALGGANMKSSRVRIYALT